MELSVILNEREARDARAGPGRGGPGTVRDADDEHAALREVLECMADGPPVQRLVGIQHKHDTIRLRARARRVTRAAPPPSSSSSAR